MTLEEQSEISREYLGKFIPMKEIALKHRVSFNLVRAIVNEWKNNPEKYLNAKEKLKQSSLRLEAIRNEIKVWQATYKPFVNGKVIIDRVNKEAGYDVSAKQVRTVLKKDFNHSFKVSKKLHPNANSIKV